MELIDSQFAVSLDAAMRSVEGIGPWLEAGWPTDAAWVPGPLWRRFGFSERVEDVYPSEGALVPAHAPCAATLPRCSHHGRPYLGAPAGIARRHVRQHSADFRLRFDAHPGRLVHDSRRFANGKTCTTHGSRRRRCRGAPVE